MFSSVPRGSAVVVNPAPAPEPDVTAPPARARSVAAAVVPLCYLLAAVLLTWRLWVDPAGRIVTGNPQDANLFAWFMRYAATAVSHGRLPALVTTGMNAPTGINLMWNTPALLPAVVLAPVTALAGAQTSLTILTTVGFAGSATALFWVLRRWDFSIASAALAGAVYGFSPALLQSALSHYDLELVILPPLIVSAGVRLAVGPPAHRSAHGPLRWLARLPAWVTAGAWLGLLVAAQLFISEEIAVTTALICVLVVLVLAISRPRTALQRLAPTAGGLVIAALVVLALAGSALWTQFRGPFVQHGSSHKPAVYVNDLTSFVTPQGGLFFHTAASAAAAARYQGGLPEYLGYLGWPLIVALAVAAVVSWRRLVGRVAAVTLVVLCLLSLGGHPLIAGETYRAVELPFRMIQAIPIFASLLADRLSILADGAAATLLAVGIDEVRSRLEARRPAQLQMHRPVRLAQTAVVAVAVVCCLPLLPRPLPASPTAPLPAGWTAVFARLRIAPGSAVLALPFPARTVTLALRWFADSGEPSSMVGGYFVRPVIGHHWRLGPQISRHVSGYLDYLWSEGAQPGSPYIDEAHLAREEWTARTWRPWMPAAPSRAEVDAELARSRAQAVVADATVSSPLGRYLVQLLGSPSVRADDVIGWRLSGSLRARGRL